MDSPPGVSAGQLVQHCPELGRVPGVVAAHVRVEDGHHDRLRNREGDVETGQVGVRLEVADGFDLAHDPAADGAVVVLERSCAGARQLPVGGDVDRSWRPVMLAIPLATLLVLVVVVRPVVSLKTSYSTRQGFLNPRLWGSRLIMRIWPPSKPGIIL